MKRKDKAEYVLCGRRVLGWKGKTKQSIFFVVEEF